MDEVQFFFDGWEPIGRIVLVTTLGYAVLVTLLRATGQRTLSRMTPFDFVVAVTIGSAFGRVITATEVSLAEAVAGFAVLIGLQWLVLFARSRWPAFSRALSAKPSLVYHDGRFLRDAMRRHRLTEQDLLIAARENGMGSVEEAYAIVLEPDGVFAVITAQQLGDGSALRALTEP